MRVQETVGAGRPLQLEAVGIQIGSDSRRFSGSSMGYKRCQIEGAQGRSSNRRGAPEHRRFGIAEFPDRRRDGSTK